MIKLTIIERYGAWLDSRSKMLSRYFGEQVEDCYQNLAVYLLTYESQATAWRKVFDDLAIEKMKREGLADYAYAKKNKNSEGDGIEPLEHLDLDTLSARDRRIVRLFLRGYRQKEISNKIKLNQGNVSRVLRNSVFRLYRDE